MRHINIDKMLLNVVQKKLTKGHNKRVGLDNHLTLLTVKVQLKWTFRPHKSKSKL